MRKELQNFLWRIANGEMNDRGTMPSAKMCQEWIAYLEKQKYDRMQPVYDNLDSFESALAKAWKAYNDSGSRTVDGCEDDYVECAHAKGFREGYLFGLEKENPKSADSIPSDCTAGAKCEDRWHKVVDSLPDNSREVLCKDAIGNFFIGRYYRNSQCWEVMMYDDCDKSNEDNPPVVKWCEIPSEKQKESLHIQETCKENADSFTAEEDGPFDEDEFLEDELSAFLQNYDKEYDDDAAVSDVARHFYEIGKKQNEQKSVPFSCGHENGQPADPVFSKQEYESHPIISTDTTSVKPVELDGKALLHTADKSYQIGFRDGVASVKPEWSEDIIRKAVKDVGLTQRQIDWFKTNVFPPKSEWSEEDEAFLKVAIAICNRYSHKDIADWLKSLRPQSHWKPSEQEKGALRTAIYVLTEERNFPKAAAQLQNILDAFNGKESRKDWKPSEEQMDRLFSIVAALRKDYCDDMADFLAFIYHNLKKLM